MNNKCVIILSYIENHSKSFVLDVVKDAEYIICADGGQDLALKYDITPDCVVGDFDSSSHDRFERVFDCEYIKYKSEKNLSDSEASIIHAFQHGYKNVVVIGGMGGRIDHTMSVFMFLLEFKDNLDSLCFIDEKNYLTLIGPGTHTIKKDEKYYYFSIMPIYERVTGLTITGAKYDLDSAELVRGTMPTLGLSNEFGTQSDTVTISIKDGYAYLMRASD